MDLDSFAITSVFIIVSALMLWFLIGARGHWLVKLFTITVVLYFSLGIWVSLGQLLGWPCHQPMPENFLVHWVVVKEPSRDGHPGYIDLWVTEMDRKTEIVESQILPNFVTKHVSEPRVHEVPYSKDMHEKAQKILSLLKQGAKVAGRGGDFNEVGNGKGNGQGGKGRLGGDGIGDFSKKQALEFYVLPPPKIPVKVTEE